MCGYVRPWPRRRRGAQALCTSTSTQPWYGRWLLSKAHPPPSPVGLRSFCWASASSSCLDWSFSQVTSGERRDGSPLRGRFFTAHIACSRFIASLVPAYGLWEKYSNQTRFLVRSSSRAQQSDSPDAHFLSGSEKCCVFLLVAHFHVFGFRSRLARRSVSRAQFSVSRKWLLACLGSSGQCYRTSGR